ncbi:Clan MG, family M24, aminopeptidase P-like metallopeptidase [Trichomonas vaginalis G3]|uniref:Clan MG, familly M24, aminopeptidase P-like metallopeptidase n=1 Tax=Trichomonas vaginalis (strain ATCC PRA-98 / G3) TaxID=412133 RepID=A2FSC5_TRIV3|nr:XAA-PRO dIpeptidase family [Trichomonas vaginalis G3]EAX92184.1 Clan MG, family M24, aminopeptidase P-like metallopeptidase [Trichomonas vaginalis G3]KAI5488459.1 XAA-PRO dIpeptidase family [Trichomonas vaginalis G3]|eukprot:XP_001305114.1 Clan MG, familly M24, aminopeptidase P-like metallopeptidase [Trichomonas vaginalis G3]
MLDVANRPMPKPEMFAAHRAKTLAELRKRKLEGVVLIYGFPEPTRAHCDFEPVFRQESCFYWLTGVNEADCAYFLDIETGKEILFYPDIPQAYIIWFGELATIDDIKKKYGFEDVRLMPKIQETLAEYKLKKIHTLPETCILKGYDALLDKNEFIDVVGELRQIKDDDEMVLIQYACDVNSFAVRDTFKKVHPKMWEHQVEANLIKHYVDYYCRCFAFSTIVCSGENCSILHYHHNNKFIEDGELILIDTGCEYNCYAADNTRTIPANGKFSPDQRAVYQAVLDCHNYVVAHAKPGVFWPDLAYDSAKVMAAGLLKLGLFQNGTVDEIVDAGALAVFYPHGLGHGMGIDCHEIAGWPRGTCRGKKPHHSFVRFGRTLEKGVVITNEPGCYFIRPSYNAAFADPEKSKYINKEVCERLRKTVGGVRIEDDLLITEDGCKVLSNIPKEIDEIEAFMAKKE